MCIFRVRGSRSVLPVREDSRGPGKCADAPLYEAAHQVGAKEISAKEKGQLI